MPGSVLSAPGRMFVVFRGPDLYGKQDGRFRGRQASECADPNLGPVPIVDNQEVLVVERKALVAVATAWDCDQLRSRLGE